MLGSYQQKTLCFFFRVVFSLSLLGALTSCFTGSASSENLEVDVFLKGRASMGPIKAATVTFYKINSDGSRGDVISTAVTDSEGLYTITLGNRSAPFEIVVSGGSYTEEAGGSSVDLGDQELSAFVDDIRQPRETSVTALTHIAAQRARLYFLAGTDFETGIQSANGEVAGASGVGDILAIPANPEQDAAGENPESQKYAVILAGISQMAMDNNINSLEVTTAFANDFQIDGQFNGSDNGTQVILGSTGQFLGSDDWDNDLGQAMNTFVNGSDNSSSLPATSVPTVVANPPPPQGVTNYQPLPADSVTNTNPVAPKQATYFAIQGPNPFPVGSCASASILVLDQKFGLITLGEAEGHPINQPVGGYLLPTTPLDPSLYQVYFDSQCTQPVTSGIPISALTSSTEIYLRVNNAASLDLNLFRLLTFSGSELQLLNNQDLVSDPTVTGSIYPRKFEWQDLGGVGIKVGDCLPFELALYDIDDNLHAFSLDGQVNVQAVDTTVFELHTNNTCTAAINTAINFGPSHALPPLAPTIYVKAVAEGTIDWSQVMAISISHDASLGTTTVLNPLAAGTLTIGP